MVRKLLISTILILGLVESLFSKDFESETKFDNINFDTKLLREPLIINFQEHFSNLSGNFSSI